MQNQQTCQADSMNSDELQLIQQSILEKEGPTLGQIHVSLSLYNFRNQLFTPMNSLNFIRSLPHSKDVKYIGSNQQTQLRAFYYVLLFLGIQQKINYPLLYEKLHHILLEYNYKQYLTVKTSHISNQSDTNKILDQQDSRNKIIDQIDEKKVEKNKQIISGYFKSVTEMEQVEEYIKKNKDFDEICIFAMREALQATYKKTQQPYQATFLFYEKLSKIFAVKFLLNTASDQNYRSYSFGEQNKFYILSEGWYTFVVLHNVKIGKNPQRESQQIQLQNYNHHQHQPVSLNIAKDRAQRPIASSAIVFGRNQVDLILTDSIQYRNGEPNLFQGLNKKQLQNQVLSHDFQVENNHYLQVPKKKKRFSKQPRNSEGCLQLVIEASEQSTPKFLQQESQNRSSFAKHRRKSHKNSFGGDIDIVNYRDIEGSILNRQRQNKKRLKLRKSSIKVKSAKFETQQIGEQFQFQDEDTKKGSRRSNKNVTEMPMWGSHCEPIIEQPIEEIPVIKKKKLSSSAAIPQDGQHEEQKLKNKERLSVVDSRHIVTEQQFFNPRISFSRNQYNRFIQQRNHHQNQPNHKITSDHYFQRHVQVKRGFKQKYQLDEIKRFYQNIPIDQSKHTQPENDNSYQNFIRQYQQVVNLNTRNPQKNYQEIFASRKVHQSQHVEEQAEQSKVQSQIHDVIYNLLDPFLKSKLRSRKFSQFNTEKSPITIDDYYKVIGMNFLKKLQESKQMVLRGEENSLNQSLFKSKSRAGDNQYFDSYVQPVSSPNISTNSNMLYQPMQNHKIKRVQDINRVRQQQLKKRFEQNSIRFSELNDPIQAMIIQQDETPPRMSPTSNNTNKPTKNQQFNPKRQYNYKNNRKPKLKLYSSIVTFQNFNSEPNDWIKKQTTFYFKQKPEQTRVICKNDNPNSYSMFSKKKPVNNKKKKSRNKSKKKKQFSEENPELLINNNQYQKYPQPQHKKTKKQIQKQACNKGNLSYLSQKEIIQRQLIQQAKQRKYTYNYGEKVIKRKHNDSGYLNNSNSQQAQQAKEQKIKKLMKNHKNIEKNKFSDDPKNILLACPQSEIGFRNSDLKNREQNINCDNQEIQSYNKKTTSVYAWEQFLVPSNASIQQDVSTIKGDSNNLQDKSNSIPQRTQANYKNQYKPNRSYEGTTIQNKGNNSYKQYAYSPGVQTHQRSNQFNQNNFINPEQQYFSPHINITNAINSGIPVTTRPSPISTNINYIWSQQNKYFSNNQKNNHYKTDNIRIQSPEQRDRRSVSPIYSPKQIQFTYKVISPNQLKSPTNFEQTKVMINRSADNPSSHYQNYRHYPPKANEKTYSAVVYNKQQPGKPNNNIYTNNSKNQTQRFSKQY